MSRPSRRASATVTYREPTEDDVFRDPEPSEVAAAERRAAKRARSASPVEVEGRGAKRRTGKESLLDALFVNHAEVEGAPDFVYSLGGADAGGAEADRILGEVESDQTMIRLTSQFSGCRRIVLFSTGRHGVKAVAAAVIELHLGGASTGGVLEVPILASARSSRAQGHGSLLTALIVELASSRLASPAQGIVPPGSQGAVALLVSSTDEARRFWLGQGCTTIPQCAQQVAAAVRGLLQRAGQRFGQQHATLMARSLPDARVLPPGLDGEAAGAPAVRGALVGAAVERTAGRVPHSGGLSCAKAAEAAGYRDVPPAGSFSLVDGKRVPALAPGAAEADGAAPATLPLGRLQAFPVSSPVSGSSTWGAPGWGVRSLAPIKAGQAVVEVCGRWRGEAEYDRLLPLERSHVLRLDERARSLLLQSGGGERGWLDLREEGSIARIVRESEEAPNLELVTYPDPSAHAPPPPESCFRLYLVAKHDIPPLAELIWERPAPGADRSHRRGRPAAAPAAAAGGGKALSADAAAAGAAEAAAFRLRSGAPVVEGSEVEVRISDAELEGARYEALVLAAGRGDGLYRVRYSCLHASAHADETLKEWVQPAAEDELRPPPPPPPDGFHARLSPGDKLELLFEGGWWPVVLTSRPPPPPAAAASSAPPPPPPPKRGLGVESAIDPARFAGLTTSAPPVRLRPAWVWEGRAGGGSGGWTFETQADGCVKLDKAGRPHQPVYQPIKHATGALPAADTSRDSEPAEAAPAAHAAKAEPLAAENGEHASPSAVMAKVEVECEPESSDEAGAEEEGAGGAEGGDSMDSQ